MAIIYTYPKLTSPQGNELIVVSDVNNRNSTRLITIASIAALVPSGGGCGTAITGIIDLNDDPLYEATLCNDVRFTSIDGSVSFSSTAGNDGVDFSVITPGISCASPTELGGVKISSQYVTEQIPTAVTQNFAAYPVETTTAGASQDECTAIVRIPNIQVDCATSVTNGTIKVASGLADNPTIADSGEYYAVQVDSNCLASVRVPIKPAVKVGFSPLEIYAGEDNVTSGREFIQAVCDVDITIDAVDYFVLTAGTAAAPTIAIYDGVLTDTPAATLLYAGANVTASVVGINTHTFTTPLTLTAGQKIVIYISIPAEFDLLGKAHGQFPGDEFVALGSATPSSIAPADLETGVEGLSSTGKKVCLHFYET